MKTKIKLFFLIVFLNIVFAGCSGKSDSNEDDMDGDIDTASPSLSEVRAVPNPTNVYNLVYTFSSSEAGTILYEGSCSSSTTSAISGENTITLCKPTSCNALDNGTTYSDCTITVSDSAGNLSNTLNLNSFFVYTSSIMGGTIQGAELDLIPTVTAIAGSGDNGSVDGTGTSASFNDPEGITSDGTNLYVTDNHSIRKIVILTGVVTTIAGSEDNGSADGTGTSASFYDPTGITSDGTNLYVVDSGNHKIRKIVIDNGTVTTIAGTGSSGSTNHSTGTSASFNNPTGITTDGTNIYVTDSGNHTIRKIVINTGAVTTLAGDSSKSGFANGTGTSAEFDSPKRITSDGTNLYVSDTSNNTIRKIVVSSGVVTTISTGLDSPNGITSDGVSLYLVNKGDSNIRKIE